MASRWAISQIFPLKVALNLGSIKLGDALSYSTISSYPKARNSSLPQLLNHYLFLFVLWLKSYA